MATRVDKLQVSLEAIGGGQFKAEMAGAAQAEREVGTAASSASAGTDKSAASINNLGKAAGSGRTSILAMAEAEAAAKRASEELAEAKRREGESFRSSEAGAVSLNRAIRELGIGAAITAALKRTVETIAAYDDLDARLVQVTKSQQDASNAMVLARASASGTAISVIDMGHAYASLRDDGIIPTLATLDTLKNLATSSRISVVDAAEAMSEAAQGNASGFEKLGVEAKTAGDQIIVTYEGVTQTIGRSSGEIIDYLESIGASSGAAERAAGTLGGAWSELKNEVSELVDALSDSGLGGTLTEVLQKFADGTSKVTSFYRALSEARERGNAFQRQLAGFLTSGPLGAMYEQMRTTVGAAPIGSAAGPNPQQTVADINAQEQARRALNEELALGTANLAALAEADAKANAQGQQTLARMTDQLEVAGKSRAAAIEYAAAQEAAKVEDKELAAQIIATGRALAAKVRALEDSRAATANARDASAALRAELKDGEAAYKQYMAELIKGEQAMIDGWNNTDKLRSAVERLEDSVDPVAAAFHKMRNAEQLLNAALEAGVINLEQYHALMKKVIESGNEIKTSSTFTSIWASTTGMSSDEAQQSIDHLEDGFARMFGNAMVHGFQDIDKQLGKLLEDTLSQAFASIIKTKIVDNIANASQGNGINGASMAEGLSTVGGAYIGGAVGGGGSHAQSGAMQGASMGAMIGTYIMPVIGTIVGAVIGGIVGGLIGSRNDHVPEIDARGPGALNANIQENYAIGPYGRIGITTKWSEHDSTELAQAVVQLDTTLSQLLTAEENRTVRAALQGFYVNNVTSPGEVLAARLNAIIQAVEPGWVGFLNRYNDVGEKAAAFGALRDIETTIRNIDSITHELTGSTMEMFRDQVHGLDDDVTKTMDAFRTAWESGVATDINTSSTAAMQALVNRYNSEMELIAQVQSAIKAAEDQAYQLNLALADRIGAITGDYSGSVAVTADNSDRLRDAVLAAQSAQEAITLLSEFVSAVDAWVSARQRQINAELDAGLAQINQRRSAIEAEIRAGQAAQAAANAARQREIAALQEQLRLANEWLAILQRAEAQQQAMQFGQSNPLSAFGRLDAINQAIAAINGGDLSTLSAEQAGQLLTLLQQRLDLLTGEGLFDRSSDEYLAQYNQTLAMIDIVRGIAGEGAANAASLQQQIADLQAQLVDATNSGFSASNASLENLQRQEDELRAEAQRQLDELNAQALAQYEWAQGQATENEDARTAELREQLEILTGGLDVQEFIALRQQEAVDLLGEIDQGLREFMQYVTDQGSGGAGGVIGGGGSSGSGGGSAGGEGLTAIGGSAGNVIMEINIDARGQSPEETARTVHEQIMRSAEILKRELKVA